MKKLIAILLLMAVVFFAAAQNFIYVSNNYEIRNVKNYNVLQKIDCERTFYLINFTLKIYHSDGTLLYNMQLKPESQTNRWNVFKGYDIIDKKTYVILIAKDYSVIEIKTNGVFMYVHNIISSKRI